MGNILDEIDQVIADILAGWNIYTSIIAFSLGLFMIWTIVDAKDADIHPFILARQAQVASVRQPKQSAIYRSPEVPHGYPLQGGLRVKYPGAPMYSSGTEGSLRDIWRRITGDLPLEQGGALGQAGKILTVLGKEQIIEHDIGDLSKEINVIGKHIQQSGGLKVAIYLPNSVELLTTVFASSFYGFTPILIPYNQPHQKLIELLLQTGATNLVAVAGSLPLSNIAKAVPALKQVIWVVERTSRHMDWKEIPEGTGSKVEVAQWHELVQDEASTPSLLKEDQCGKPGNLIFLWQDAPGEDAEIVEFTHRNVMSAIAALTTALPHGQRMSPSDTLLPCDSLTLSHTLCYTLAALFLHTTVAINSVAGPGIDLQLAARQISPTIIISSAESAVKLLETAHLGVTGQMKKLAHWSATQALTQGRMPTDTMLTRVNAPHKVSIGATPGKLRALIITERAGISSTPLLTSSDLGDVRVFTGARVIYTLTAAQVAGAITQTHFYDYRREGGKSRRSHLGAPVSSVEVYVQDTDMLKTTNEEVKGEIVIQGPAVAGGKVELGINGRIRDDGCLEYV